MPKGRGSDPKPAWHALLATPLIKKMWVGSCHIGRFAKIRVSVSNFPHGHFKYSIFKLFLLGKQRPEWFGVCSKG